MEDEARSVAVLFSKTDEMGVGRGFGVEGLRSKH